MPELAPAEERPASPEDVRHRRLRGRRARTAAASPPPPLGVAWLVTGIRDPLDRPAISALSVPGRLGGIFIGRALGAGGCR